MCNSNENNFSFIPYVCHFSYHPWIALSKEQSLTTLFSTKMRGEETQSQEHQHPCLMLLEFRHSSPPLCINHKKPDVDKKIQICETLTLTKGFVFFSYRCSKQSVSCLTLNLSEHIIRWGCFHICSGNNSTSLVLSTCEVIHSINKGVASPYVEE